MFKMTKKIFIVLAVTLCLFVETYAGEWVQEGNYWTYMDEDGMVIGEQKVIDGKWYMFDEKGHLVTGLYQNDDKFYSFNSDGIPNVGSIEYNGKKYVISNKGEIKGITEEEFDGYRDSLSALYILGGGYDVELVGMLDVGLEQAKNYFNTLPLSRKAFRKIFSYKSYNKDAIDYMLNSVEINWKQQALKVAKEFYDKSQLGRLEMKNILVSEGFTEIEAGFGTEMAFGNDVMSSGVGKKNEEILLKDYYDKMSQVIIGYKISDVEEAEKKAKQQATMETTIAATNVYKIKNKVRRTLQLNITDDDVEGGKVKVKITLPVPVLEGPKDSDINKLLEDDVFIEVRKYLEYNYYEKIRHSLKYTAGIVEITAQDINSITLTFKGDVDVPLVIDLNSLIFKSDIIK